MLPRGLGFDRWRSMKIQQPLAQPFVLVFEFKKLITQVYVNVTVLWVSSEPFVLCVRFRFGNPENLSQLLLKASKQCAAKIDIHIIVYRICIFKLLLLGLYKWNILSQYHHQYHDDDDDKEPLLARCANCTATDLNVATENLLREPDQKIKFPNWILGPVSPFLPVWKLGSKLPQFPNFIGTGLQFHRGYAMTMAHSFQHGARQALGKPFVQRQFIVSAIRFLGRVRGQGHYRETKGVKVEGPLGGLVDVRCCCCCSNFWVKVQIRIPFDG